MQKKHGFTLVELLVVIAIIGILAGIVAPKLFGGMDSAKEQQCRNNLRQLQAGALDFAIENDSTMPKAGGFEFWGQGMSNGKNGWVAWVPKDLGHPLSWHGTFGGTSQEPQFSDDLGLGDPTNDGFPGRWAIRNGQLWEYVKNETCYACPATKNLKDVWMELDSSDPESAKPWEVYRTYKMNSFFGGPFNRRGWAADECYLTKLGVSQYTDSGNPMKWMDKDSTVNKFRHIPQPSRLLLFTEGLPSPNGKKNLNGRKSASDLAISPYSPALSVKNVSGVSVYSKGLKWRGRGSIAMGFPKDTDMICGLHEPLIVYRPAGTDEAPVYLGSALAVFVDGHIEKVFPVYETSDGIAEKPINAAWYYCHGLRPSETVPTN